MATVYIGGASIDENGKAHGGKAGNQTGKELKKQKWYLHSKGWRVFRAKDAAVAAKVAACMDAAVANRHIGYDQYQRNTLYREAEKYGFDVGKVTADVECDCSALVRVCCAYAGVTGLPEGFRTTNEPKNLLATGAFTEMTGDRYAKQSDCLKAGDILCTPVQGHTVIVLNDGPRAASDAREAWVEITGGSVNVRNAPGTVGTRILGVAHRGDRLADLGETRDVDGRPWYRVAFRDGEAWVSSRYARRV